MKQIWILGVLVVCAVVGGIFLGLVRTRKIQTSDNQKRFLAGVVPNPAPDGFFKGSTTEYKGSWQGKEFDATHSWGSNVFKENGELKKRFPFKTYVGKGLADRNLDVLKIDYNIRENPLWLRLILDEIVEVKPGKYLGKLHLRLFLFLPFSLGYFTLEK